MIVVRADGDKTIVLSPNANLCWEEGAERDVARRVKESGAGTVLAVDLEVPLPIVRAALTAARANGLTTVLDPSPADRMTDDLYALTDYLTPNPRETERLTGSPVRHAEDAIGAARTLIAAGARSACVKLPDGGALLMGDGAPQLVHAPKVQVVDKTGAGDAFAGALAVALAKARSPRDAVDYAVLASSYAVTVYGSQAGYPTADALARFAAANA
jgi:ribokinase